MMKDRELVFATKNEGKMKEVREILQAAGCKVLSMAEAGIDIEVEEDGTTFEENAIKKATAIMEVTGRLVLADDSGLEVDYIGGEPGVYSARYGGVETPYAVKNQMIMERLEKAQGEERSARFICVIAAAFPDGRTLTARGTIEGVIGYEEKGSNGFGYDPIFMVPEYGCTTAEMASELKNAVSHRGKALRAMKDLLVETADC